MKWQDVVIKKVFFCMFDTTLEVVPYSGYVPGDEDEMYRYLCQMVAKYYYHETSRKGFIHEESELQQILPETGDQFEAFVNCICDEIQDLMHANPEIQTGAGMFAWVTLEDQDYITFFKSNYQSRFLMAQDENSAVHWTLNHMILPGPSPKVNEYFYLNLNDNQAQVSDFECYIDGLKQNYLADQVLKLDFKPSEAVTVKAIDDSVVETIKHCYEEQAPQKIMEYKTIVADQVKEKGQIIVPELEEAVFKDNEQAAVLYQEVAEQQQIPKIPVYVSKKTERKLGKKQKLVTDSGIELLVPLELLKDESILEYHQNDDGKMSILIKEIGFIENK